MKKTALALGLLAAAAFVSGCATTGAPVSGMFYTDVKYAGEQAHPLISHQTGEACASTILGLIATGDASIATAAKNGHLTQVTHVDHTGWSVLGVIGKHCTVAYGKAGADAAK